MAEQEIILDKTICLSPEDSKTNICIPFTLKKNCRSLEFVSSYEPKKCEDREKALDFVLAGFETYIPEQYRGLCGAPEDYIPSVVSLVTLSIDSPVLYLGSAHRHADRQRHIISADFSSPGFIRHSPDAGDWRAVINVHAVVSPKVIYRLQIFAHNEAS